VRIRTLPILLLAILAALVVVAIVSAAQTPPPASGDWDIADDTVFTDTELDVPGSIIIRAFASLTLTDVNITLTRSFGLSTLTVEPGGRLTWDGGRLDRISYVQVFLVSGCSVNGVAFGEVHGVYLRDFGINVTNCTFGGSSSYGLFVNPVAGDPTKGPIIVADNTFTNLKRSPITVAMSTSSNATARLVLVNNVMDGVEESDGINMTATAVSAHITVSGNRVSDTAMNGITMYLMCPQLTLRFNHNHVSNVLGDGVLIVVDSTDLEFRGILDLWVEDAGGVGLSVWAARVPIDGLLLANHTNLRAGQAAISLLSAMNVSLDMSRIVTDGTDFVVNNSTLDIRNSIYNRGSARVTGSEGRISSWKWIDLHCGWDGGIPLSDQRVDLLSPLNDPRMTAITDEDGYWGNQTYCDWCETENSSRIVENLQVVMVHPEGNLTGGNISTDQSRPLGINFIDPQLPVLTVDHPDGDVLQNTTELHINGSCRDPHSGVARVQFSFDPNPDWNSKIWTDVNGLERWSVDTLHLSEGVYTLYMRAYDRVGAVTATYARLTVGQVVIDMTPPVIQVTSPDVRHQPVIVNTTTIQVDGWVSEPVSSVRIQRMAVPMTGTSFSLEAFVSEGENELVISATDLAGNTARYTFKVLRDTAPPVITLTAPAPGALINATSVHVAGLVDDGLPPDLVEVNGVPATLSSGTFDILLTGLGQGQGSIDVTAVDLAGNTASLAVKVIIDSLPPALELVSPSDGLLTSQATVTLEGITEAGANITVRGVPVPLEGSAFTHSVDLVEGDNLVQVTAVDEAGNVNSTMVLVRRDSTPPALTVHGLVNGSLQAEGLSAHVNGMTEPGAFLFLMMDGTSVQVIIYPDGSFIQPVTVHELETRVTLRAEDAAGNVAFEELNVLRGEVQQPASQPTPTPVDPVVTATVVTSTTIIIVGVAMSFEISKYALVLMALPLYARIKKHEVLDNKTRLAIHGLVVENPGMHYNEIIREFDLTNGVAAYHLDVLEREGFIRSVRDGTLRRFYSSATKVPGDHKATPDQVREHILEMVTENPGINQKTIVDELGIGRTLVGYHLKTLIDEGYIESHKSGRFTVYSRTRKRWFRLN
jgi:DNA-binding MarR family transcriptional regulator